MARIDPFRNYRFRVEIDGITTAAFSEATVPEISSEVVDYREGTDAPHVRKLSALTKYGNVTLKKGLGDSMELYNWHKTVTTSGSQSARKNLSLILVDETGADKARWDIVEAWPVKIDTSDFNGKGNEVMIDTLELVNEGISRVR